MFYLGHSLAENVLLRRKHETDVEYHRMLTIMLTLMLMIMIIQEQICL
jgi:hypothetical protein